LAGIAVRNRPSANDTAYQDTDVVPSGSSTVAVPSLSAATVLPPAVTVVPAGRSVRLMLLAPSVVTVAAPLGSFAARVSTARLPTFVNSSDSV
jgi:hypothetical protein